jgi:hypothetical protein
MTKERGIGYRGGVLAVVNGRTKSSSRNNKRRAVENRKRLVRAYVASDIGVGAGTRVGALVRSLVSPRKPPSLIFVSELKPSLRSSSQFSFLFICHI